MPIKQNKIWKFFASLKLAIWLLVVISFFSLLGTFILQNQEPANYIARYGHTLYKALAVTGLINIYSAWWFILLLGLFSLNLAACLLSRLSLKKHTLGTFICHISILVILLGALIGMLFGQKGYIKVSKAQEIDSFISRCKEVEL